MNQDAMSSNYGASFQDECLVLRSILWRHATFVETPRDHELRSAGDSNSRFPDNQRHISNDGDNVVSLWGKALPPWIRMGDPGREIQETCLNHPSSLHTQGWNPGRFTGLWFEITTPALNTEILSRIQACEYGLFVPFNIVLCTIVHSSCFQL